MTHIQNKIEFKYLGWTCWQNDSHGNWGAVLSQKGLRPIVVDGKRSKEELLEAIQQARTRLESKKGSARPRPPAIEPLPDSSGARSPRQLH